VVDVRPYIIIAAARLDTKTKETVIAVCERVLKQSEWDPSTSSSLKLGAGELRATELFVAATVLEVRFFLDAVRVRGARVATHVHR